MFIKNIKFIILSSVLLSFYSFAQMNDIENEELNKKKLFEENLAYFSGKVIPVSENRYDSCLVLLKTQNTLNLSKDFIDTCYNEEKEIQYIDVYFDYRKNDSIYYKSNEISYISKEINEIKNPKVFIKKEFDKYRETINISTNYISKDLINVSISNKEFINYSENTDKTDVFEAVIKKAVVGESYYVENYNIKLDDIKVKGLSKTELIIYKIDKK